MTNLFRGLLPIRVPINDSGTFLLVTRAFETSTIQVCKCRTLRYLLFHQRRSCLAKNSKGTLIFSTRRKAFVWAARKGRIPIFAFKYGVMAGRVAPGTRS